MIGRLYVWRGAVWLLRVRGEPFDRGPRRNVLLERVVPVQASPAVASWRGVWFEGRGWWRTGEHVVRPFRGLRRWTP